MAKTHDVMTAFTILVPRDKKMVTRIVKTKVGFRKLSKMEIEWYLKSREPLDKAGSYAIQGLAQYFVREIKGDLLNVVGLPLFEFKKELRKHGWQLQTRRSANRS